MKAIGNYILITATEIKQSAFLHIAGASAQEQAERRRGSPLEGVVEHVGLNQVKGDAEAIKNAWFSEPELTAGSRVKFWSAGSCKLEDINKDLWCVPYSSLICIVEDQDVLAREERIAAGAAGAATGSAPNPFQAGGAKAVSDDHEAVSLLELD